MGIAEHLLASGDGFRVRDVVCTHGPNDPVFEEQHAVVSIAIVTAGTFQYRTQAGAATLSPGAVLLGNADTCYECGHAHASGDRCIAFQLDPALFDSVLAAQPGVRRPSFRHANLPPLLPLVPLLAEAEVARDARDADALEELALRVAAAAATIDGDAVRGACIVDARDDKRIADVLQRIERAPQAAHSLKQLAADARMSRYHFLRTFRRITGLTPHQYVLRLRLHRAALHLRNGTGPITAIAYDAGFNDLSTFNHRFRRFFGTTPSAWRAGR